jgi:DNA-binding transcriptional regulator YiaG
MNEFIKEHFKSKRNLARELGVTEATIQNWGRNPSAMYKHLPKLCDITGLSASEILKEIEG